MLRYRAVAHKGDEQIDTGWTSERGRESSTSGAAGTHEDPDGQPYPQLATVAMQQGKLVSRNILRKQHGRPLDPFQYIDKGSMATIGRRRAVARIWGRNFSGPIAWVLWLAVHLLYLIGVRNRIVVLINWAYNYLTHDRGARAAIAARPRDAGQA